jgi:hypothetical protein
MRTIKGYDVKVSDLVECMKKLYQFYKSYPMNVVRKNTTEEKKLNWLWKFFMEESCYNISTREYTLDQDLLVVPDQ